MTFIIAIQLHDSIIVAADTKKVIQQEDLSIKLSTHPILKLHTWEKGIISGTGEYHVVSRAVEIFKKFRHSEVSHLPQCLNISRQLRELEVGTHYTQIQQTKLLCSSYTEQGAQLYKVERFDPSEPYQLIPFEAMDINIWLVDLNIQPILTEIQSLYNNLKDYAEFHNPLDWVNYYTTQIAPIFKKHSQQDMMMSPAFDLYCQTNTQNFCGHISNTDDTPICFRAIIPNTMFDLT